MRRYPTTTSYLREFHPPRGAIETHAAIDIQAPPEEVAAVYADVRNWSDLYPATIKNARVTATGENWKHIEVLHKMEGIVPNTLIFLSPTKIGLEESKPRFDASFLNDFQPAEGGATHYEITSFVSPKGIYRLLKPFLTGYVRRQSLKQMQNYVLRPIKAYAESHRSD